MNEPTVVPTEPPRQSMDGYRRLALAVIFSAVDDYFDPDRRGDAIEFFCEGEERYFVLAGIDREKLYDRLRKIDEDKCHDRKTAVRIHLMQLKGQCNESIAKRLGGEWTGQAVKEFLDYF